MGFWSLLNHLSEFLAPALGTALPLAWVVWRRGPAFLPATPWRRVLAAWGLLAVLGSAVLLGGLWWFGRDGKMATYAALVVVMGSVTWWLRRPQG